MKNKDKQIRELEKESDMYYNKYTAWCGIGIFLMIILIILFIGLIMTFINNDKLETQLLECKDKVPIWIVSAKCEISESIDSNVTWSFNNYTEYQESLESVRDLEFCEIIK